MFFITYLVAVFNSSKPLFRYTHHHQAHSKHITAGQQRVKLVVLSKPHEIKKHSQRTRIWAKFFDLFEPANEYSFTHISFPTKLKIIARNNSFVKKTVHYSSLRGPPVYS